MQLFKRQETSTGNIALLGIFSAILAVFSLIIAFVPFTSVVFSLILPLISAVATYYVQKKYIPLYVIGASLVCLGVTFFDIGDTLFFIIPSIISGSLFGFLRTNRLFPQLNLLIISVVQFVLHVIAYFLLIAITGVDMLDVITTILGLNSSFNYSAVFAALLISLSFGETGLNYLIIEGVIERFEEIEAGESFKERLCGVIIAVFLGILCIVMAFGVLDMQLMPVLFVLTLYFSISGTDYLFTKKRPIWIYVLLGILLLASLFFVAIFYQNQDSVHGLGLLAAFPISLSIATFVSILENKMAK